ncbi:type I restriction enzyme HsdR N-terminal domain-containing protein [Lepagella muris]|uniref:type I restriction enzyme HsdR N-terminal domain-containing protein n=1 Tax=Lepagella muris TaxID=3032870 RepID=UPI0023B80A79|nr:type I restriction enzyme HsdR N-terminal domain-containing protein [Lepagella muris]
MTNINLIGKQFPSLNLPPTELRLCRGDNHIKVYDRLRKKYVTLTPEEYVRQHFVDWLIKYKNYPSSIVSNEVGIVLNGTKKRCDTIIFMTDGSPLMIVEYKAPDIEISQCVFDQIVRYNMTLKARFLAVSNGINHYCCEIDYVNGSYRFMRDIPTYNEIKNISIK